MSMMMMKSTSLARASLVRIAERHAEIGETAQEETPTSRTTTEEQGTVDRRWKISNAAPQGMTLTMVGQRSVQLGAGSEAQIPQSYDMQEVYIQVRRNDLSQIAHVGGYNVRIRQDGRIGGSFCFICTRLDGTMRAAVTIGMTHERDRTPSMVETQPTAAERELVDRNLLRQQSWGGGCGSRNWIFRNDTLDIPEHQMTVVTRQIVEVAPGETEHIPHTHNMREVYLLAGYDGDPDIDDVERHNIATVRHTRVGTFFGLKCTRLDDASAAAMTIDIIRQEDTEDGYGEGSEDEEHVLNADPGAFVLHPHRNAHRRQPSAERGHGVGEIQSANVGQEHATDKHSDQRHNTELTHDVAKDAETTQPLPEGAVGGCACQECDEAVYPGEGIYCRVNQCWKVDCGCISLNDDQMREWKRYGHQGGDMGKSMGESDKEPPKRRNIADEAQDEIRTHR